MEAGGFDKKKLIIINCVQKFKGYALEASEFGGLFLLGVKTLFRSCL